MNKKKVANYLNWRKFRRKLKRYRKKYLIKKRKQEKYEYVRQSMDGDFSMKGLLNKFLPPNLSYMLDCPDSDFYYDKLLKNIPNNKGFFYIPESFSIVDHPQESFAFLQRLLAVLVTQKYSEIKLSYKNCKRIDLGAQVLLDIILKDIISFYNKLDEFPNTQCKVTKIDAIDFEDEYIGKMLYSVGSPAIHLNKRFAFKDIEPYRLCIHDRGAKGDPGLIMVQKDIDTTELVDYVINSLSRLNINLESDKIDDLCKVIGEILINAEEHSTTKYRFSIGYFHELTESGRHYGVFRLAILNFGKTIYETFKGPNANVENRNKMKKLSSNYKLKNFFSSKKFEEETLWTLYALQEGITSVPNAIRGNGSIQFIDSFFNIKGEKKFDNDDSRMAILSGNTNITFDGTYSIKQRTIDGENFKVMTFNDSGDIEEKPDSSYVKYVDNYFPGTLISAKIIFEDDDYIS